ncbi:Outer membrane usher protein papC, partial [human gut metagenome]
ALPICVERGEGASRLYVSVDGGMSDNIRPALYDAAYTALVANRLPDPAAGQVRYKVTMGRPQNWDHQVAGSFFSGGEASWGIANGWSLYGGALADENYQSAALGLGRDLALLGALAFDV